MEILSTIFHVGVGLVLLFSGISKIFSIKENQNELKILKIIPNYLLVPLSYLLPIFEVLLAISLLFRGDIIYVQILAIVLLLSFVFIHIDAMLNKKETKCFCFGNMISAKHGLGGLIQTILLLLSLIPSVLYLPSSLYLLMSEDLNIKFYIILISAFFWGFILVLSRRLLDEI
ncbi:MauE/DoxX family redox-associated membrane protein [Paenibacillus sp. PK4536]|uniref:MauE/DoxX family redox-associated membrane protein n=1 Tax=Paenibacillus sp. PK4536 TaxID=3024576 RepID=UPI0023596600|nr:MauE/DoxX family redox-associated membrane protein [Paenibacillus sp. PK4536]WIM40958.1 MauE/DoxX family redox-associated membrane protein [Paenibacillus sp. PK4536]